MESKTEQVEARTRTVKNPRYTAPKNVFVNVKGEGRYVYYRRKGFKLIPLPNLPFDHPDFKSAYDEAVKATGARQEDPRNFLVRAVDYALKKARARAAERDLAYNLTLEGVMDLLDDQGGKCALTGLPFAEKPERDGKRNPYAPSLDRVDLTLGYIKGNVRIVTCIANIARADFGDDAFYRMCSAGAIKNKARRG